MGLKEKTKKYLNKNCANLEDKTYIITGATSGIGLKAVEELIYLKAKVLMAVRSPERAEELKKSLIEEYPNADITIYPLDLASLDSIKKFAARVKRNKIDIYGFINNAGVYHSGDAKTEDGYNLVMGTNYLGTYMLIERMLPYFITLPHEVKLINTTSISYKSGKINYNDFFFEKKKKSDFKVYSRSKLCLTRYSIYLANKHMDTNIVTLMTHPGIVKSKLLMDMFKPWYMRIFKPLSGIFMKPERGALSIPYALSKEARSGSLIGPNGMFQGWGNPTLNKLKKKAYFDIERLIVYTKNVLKNKDI